LVIWRDALVGHPCHTCCRTVRKTSKEK